MRGRRLQALALVLGVMGWLAAGLTRADEVDRALTDESDGRDWPGYGRTYSEDHYSPLTQIDPSTLGKLRLAWSFELDSGQRADSQPLEMDGVLYVASGLSVVYALDATTGALLWRYDPQVGAVAGDRLRPSWGIRGLALGQGRVYVGTQDGRLVALDARRGTLTWSQMTLAPDDETTITGAPRYFDGKVVIGFAGGERLGTRGAVTCLDAASGRLLWRFYTVPGDPARGEHNRAMRIAARTWTGQPWKYGGGGAVWNAITFDPQLQRLYIGTGNAQPWNWKIRNPQRRDNLFTASIVALDANTGRYLWHYQVNPDDAWDFDATMDMQLATLHVGGRNRHVLMQAPKNGFFYLIDRDSGKLICAQKIEKVSWAQRIDLRTGRPVEERGIRYESGHSVQWPGTYGAHNWPPMAFSPQTQLVYIPTLHAADAYASDAVSPQAWAPTRNTWITGLGGSAPAVPAEEFASNLLAWSPVEQRAAWKVRTAGVWGPGVLATGGGLVFQGQLDGTFVGYDARTGEKRWSFDAGVPVIGAPSSFSVEGRQFIVVMAGPITGTVAAIASNLRFRSDYHDPRRVLAFALEGSAVLPAVPGPGVMPAPAPTSASVPTPASASAETDAHAIEIGSAAYAAHCAHCHGMSTISGGAAPDLRRSPIVRSRGAFAQIVQTGALVQRGMPKFAELTTPELEAIRSYVLTQDAPAAPERPGRP